MPAIVSIAMPYVPAVRIAPPCGPLPLSLVIQKADISCPFAMGPVVQTGLLTKAFEYVGDQREALAARHPFRGLGEVGDVVGPAVFLASEYAKWGTGVPLAVDGGYTAQ